MNLKAFFAGVKYRTEKGEVLLSRPYDTLQAISKTEYSAGLTIAGDGCVFTFNDIITVCDNGYKVKVSCRASKLTESVSGVGIFCGYTLVEDYNSLEFFCPSAWYGKGSHFEGDSNKYPFIGGIAGGGIDGIGAPVCAAYCGENKNGYSLEVVNPSYTAVISVDNDVIIDDRNTLSGIGVRDDGGIGLYFQYPATFYHIAGSQRNVEYYLPARQGMCIEGEYEVKEFTSPDYYSCMKHVWRSVYEKYARLNKRVDTTFAAKAVTDYIVRSYAVVSDTPQYYTNADHFANESGFLYRNADIAYIMLRHGYAVGDEQIIQNAKSVIDSQVKNKYAGAKQVFPFERSRAEGCIAIFRAYRFLKDMGEDHLEWLSFVQKEAERFLVTDEYYSIPLLCWLGYTAEAVEKGEKIWQRFSGMNFYGGVVDFVGAVVLDRESGFIGADGFFTLFEATGESKWLERATFCADYLETYQNLREYGFYQPNTDGNEHYNMASIGNEGLNLSGLSFVSATCSAGDIMNTIAVPLYYKLFKATGDKHYYDYAVYLERNCLEYVDLFDKAGSLSDVMLNSGLGYMPEYFQLAISSDPVCPYTGCAHDATIAWVGYVLLYSRQEIFDLTGGYVLEENRVENTVMNIAPDCMFTCEGRVLDNLNALDFYKRTELFAGERLEIKLSAPSQKIVFSHSHKYGKYIYSLAFYGGNELLGEEKSSREARFTSFNIPSGCDKIAVVPQTDVDFRQIQIFGLANIKKAEEHQRLLDSTLDKDYFASGSAYSANLSSQSKWRYLYKRNGEYKSMRYDNVQNAYGCADDKYLQIKTGNLVHAGNTCTAVKEFTVPADGVYDIVCEISVSPYLKYFGRGVCMQVYEDDLLLGEKTLLLQRKRMESLSFKRKLKKGKRLYFEIFSAGEDNRNCFITHEIIIRKEEK